MGWIRLARGRRTQGRLRAARRRQVLKDLEMLLAAEPHFPPVPIQRFWQRNQRCGIIPSEQKVSSRLSLRGRRRTTRFVPLGWSVLGLVAPRGQTPISTLCCSSSMRRPSAPTPLGLTLSHGNKRAYGHQLGERFNTVISGRAMSVLMIDWKSSLASPRYHGRTVLCLTPEPSA
jgi:hypothetical protein